MHCANSTHTAAGELYDGSQYHGFVRTADGTLTQFDPDGGTYTDVTAINDSGTATGTSQFGSIGEGFIRTADRTISTFAAGRSADNTIPRSINKAAGTIVGNYRNADGSYHGFVRPMARSRSSTISLNRRPVLDSVNDKGQATGVFELNGEYVRFVWKP